MTSSAEFQKAMDLYHEVTRGERSVNSDALRRVVEHPPIIFLDYHGILLTKDCEKRGEAMACTRLDRFLRATRAKLVITSPWRLEDTVAHHQGMLRSWGVYSAEVIGFTPTFGAGMNRQQRLDEIQEWCRINDLLPLAPLNYLIFDSDYMAIGRKAIKVDRFYSGGIQEMDINQAFKVIKETAEGQVREFPQWFGNVAEGE